MSLTQWLEHGNAAFLKQDWEEAARCYQNAIDLDPNHPKAHYNLGLVLKQKKNWEKALNEFQTVIAIDPHSPAAYFQIGCIELEQKHFLKAKHAFLWVMDHYPDHLESAMNLGIAYLELQRFHEAERVLHHAERLNDQDIQILYNLGVIKNKLNQKDAAIFYYQRVIALNPEHGAAHYNLALIYKEQNKMASAQQHIESASTLLPEHAPFLKSAYFSEHRDNTPETFIEHLFDEYAESYDQHLTHTLHYQLPSVFFELYKTHAVKKHPSILDLGAGTGLCGVLFSSVTEDLAGVDLSEKMLNAAREKKCYSALHHASILDFLKKNTKQFDAVIAADTFSYLGKLEDYFFYVHALLNENGLFIFNVDHLHTSSEPFSLMHTARFSYDVKYIKTLSRQHQFSILEQKEVESRTEENSKKHTWVFVVRKT